MDNLILAFCLNITGKKDLTGKTMIRYFFDVQTKKGKVNLTFFIRVQVK